MTRARTNCQSLRFKSVMTWAICWERPSLANAKLRVRAARTMRKIMPVVRTAEIIESRTITKLRSKTAETVCRSGMGAKRSVSRALGVNILINPVPFKNRPAKGLIKSPELSRMARTKAPVTPNAAASLGAAIFR